MDLRSPELCLSENTRNNPDQNMSAIISDLNYAGPFDLRYQ